MVMANFPLYISLVLFSSQCSVWATRYLPTIVWDHLNPLLSCKCNWLVVPRVDLYDQQQFTCPTTEIYTNLLDGYLRQDTQRNENIFRRKWLGTRNDLMNSIKNGSIDSFCDPTNSDTSLVHRCRGGSYSSSEVIYEYSENPAKLYNRDNIYVFFNNGDDGRASTLRSKQAKCTTFFAVYVTSNEKTIHGMDYGKPALTISKNCKLSSCSLVTTSPSIDASPTNSRTRAHTEQLTNIPSSTIQQFSSRRNSGTPSMKPNVRDGSKSAEKQSRSTERPGTKQPKKTVVCIETWLNTTIFIVVVIAAFFAGIFCTIFVFAIRRALKTKDLCNNGETIGSPMYGSPQTEVPQDPQPQKESVFSRNL